MSFDVTTLALAKSYTNQHGVGGGQVQPDWNQNDSTAADYVKNRPFYTGDPVETVLVEETTVSFVDNGGVYEGGLDSTFSPTVGETYKVSWDGTVYECTCVDYNDGTIIGNLSIIGEGSDTGEPFLMFVTNGLGFEIGTLDTSASHTFSISGAVQEVVKIDDKYLPEGYPTKSVQTTTLMEEREVAFALNGGVYGVELTEGPKAVEGQTYTVNWDGTEYECVCVAVGPESMLALGNLSIMGMGGDTGEPFLYGYDKKHAKGIFVTLDTSASHTISVTTTAETITPMAEEYLPSNLATKSDVEVAQTTANKAQTTANKAQTTANKAQTTANKAQATAETAQATAETAQAIAGNSKIDPNSYNYSATLFSTGGEFIGWYEAMPKLGYKGTLGNFYRSPFEITPLKYEDIPFNNFICNEYLKPEGVPSGWYTLFLTKQLTNNGNSWKVTGVAIHELGYMFYVKSAVVGKSTGEGLFLDFLPQNYILISSSTANSTKKFKITVDDSGTISATEVTST